MAILTEDILQIFMSGASVIAIGATVQLLHEMSLPSAVSNCFSSNFKSLKFTSGTIKGILGNNLWICACDTTRKPAAAKFRSTLSAGSSGSAEKIIRTPKFLKSSINEGMFSNPPIVSPEGGGLSSSRLHKQSS